MHILTWIVQPKRRSHFLFVLFLFALLIRIAYIWIVLPWMEARVSLEYTGDAYGILAEHFLEGKYRSIQRGPVYPAFLALLYRLFGRGHLWPIRVAQGALDAGTGVVVGVLAGWMFGPWSALFGGLLYALYPLAIWNIAFVNKEPLFTFLTALFTLSLIYSLRNPSLLRFVLCGLAFGVATLCKPVLQFFPVMLLVGMLYAFRGRWQIAVKGTGAIVLSAALVIAPWTLRNYKMSGRFIPVATEMAGTTFFVGTYVPSYGAWEGPRKHLWEEAVQRIRDAHPGLSAVEEDALFLKEGWKNVVHHPWASILLMGLKFFRFWFISASGRMLIILIPTQLAYLLLAVWGLTKSNWTPASAFLLMVIGYFTGIHMASYACVRFSSTVMPYVNLLGGHGLKALLHAERRARNPKSEIRNENWGF